MIYLKANSNPVLFNPRKIFRFCLTILILTIPVLLAGCASLAIPVKDEKDPNDVNFAHSPGAYIQKGGDVIKNDKQYTAYYVNESGVFVTFSGLLTLMNSEIHTTGNSDSPDNSSFLGQNAGVLAKDSSVITMEKCNVITEGMGANGVFAYGTAQINLKSDTITCTGRLAHAIMASGGGKIMSKNVVMETSGNNSAAIATDRGGGMIDVTGGSALTTGKDAPGIYSTGILNVAGTIIEAKNSEGAVIEGKNEVLLVDTWLTGGMNNYGGALIMQSMSGDAEVGSANFRMMNGFFGANSGALFFITNTKTNIELTNVKVKTASGILINAAGTTRWGRQGQNGGDFNFTAKNQTMEGSILVDEVSSGMIELKDTSSFTGNIDSANTAKTAGIKLDASSSWSLTADSYVDTFKDDTAIEGNTVTNVSGNGYNIYYDSNLNENKYLKGQTYSLKNGGSLLPH